MRNQLGRAFAVVCVGIWTTGTALLGAGADPSPIPRGESGNSLSGVTKALELMQRDPQERLHKRLGSKAKDIRFKMLVRKKDDKVLSPEYEWATRAKAKGSAPQVVYPYEELLNGESGRVTIRFRINYEGRVDSSMVLEATKPVFGRAAQAAIETMVFTPAKKKDGTPALVLCDADFEFSPDGNGDVLVTDEVRDLLKAMQKREDAVTLSTELDQRLSPITTSSPNYPTVFAKVGTAGSATIEFVITDSGWVILPRVISATAPEFGAAAAQAVSLWQFKPPVKKGRAVTTRASIEIEFNPTAAAKS